MTPRQSDDEPRGNRSLAADQQSDDPAQLLKRIAAAYPGLSPLMRRIARDVERNASMLAMDSIQVIACRCGARPSAIVRFARLFGYEGFRAFRDVFRRGLRNASPACELAASTWRTRMSGVAQQASWALEAWQQTLDERALNRASDRLLRAGRIRIAAMGDATAVGHYALYALLELGRPVEVVASFRAAGPIHFNDDVWILVGLRNRCPLFDETAARLRAMALPTILIVDTRAQLPSDAAWDEAFLTPDLGGLDLSGVAGAIEMCGVIFAGMRQRGAWGVDYRAREQNL